MVVLAKVAEENVADETGRPAQQRWLAALMARRMWLLGFAAFFLFGAAWSFASPYDGPPDEQEHVLRAAGVVYGDIAPPPANVFRGVGTFQRVPKSLIQPRCFNGDASKTADCAKGPTGDQSLVVAGSYIGRYNPVYYAVVGWPLRFWPSWKGLYLARLMTAGICALLWASALTAALRWTRYRAIGVGAIIGITPMALHLAGSVNPNAVEAAAGALLFAALIPLLVDAQGPISRTALWQSGIAAATIGVVRWAGPIWLGGAVFVLLAAAGRQRLRELFRSRAVWIWAGSVGAILLAGVVWSFVQKAYAMAPLPMSHKYTFFGAVIQGLFSRTGVLAWELIGVAGYLDTAMPTLFYFMWCMLAGALILPALALGRWSDRWRVGGMLAVTFGLPFASETVGVNTYGFGTQGRYMLVTAVGVTMLAAYAIFREGMLNNTMLVRFTRLVVPIAAGLQVFFLVGSMERWQRGMNGYDFWMDPFTGVWHPRVGSVLPVVLGLLGAVALIVYGWKVSVEDGNAPSGKATLVEPARATL